MASRAAAWKRCPAGVRRVGYDERSISATPTHCSSDLMRRLKADCVMWRSAADSEKLPVRATLENLRATWLPCTVLIRGVWVRRSLAVLCCPAAWVIARLCAFANPFRRGRAAQGARAGPLGW